MVVDDDLVDSGHPQNEEVGVVRDGKAFPVLFEVGPVLEGDLIVGLVENELRLVALSPQNFVGLVK